ncbi:hypothetical protein Tdes44962_MAKER01152 [Teratosphaeria destructans]|uniref:Uncharacterized protein n=1 Tax=Teratosphaeria destructans TaxID=418781 RepID=A0A9W7W7Z7_9PEZI|nr:hypothetical protein Tdes44962_MAKER01152 [Teratosphaeria destructans]
MASSDRPRDHSPRPNARAQILRHNLDNTLPSRSSTSHNAENGSPAQVSQPGLQQDPTRLQEAPQASTESSRSPMHILPAMSVRVSPLQVPGQNTQTMDGPPFHSNQPIYQWLKRALACMVRVSYMAVLHLHIKQHQIWPISFPRVRCPSYTSSIPDDILIKTPRPPGQYLGQYLLKRGVPTQNQYQTLPQQEHRRHAGYSEFLRPPYPSTQSGPGHSRHDVAMNQFGLGAIPLNQVQVPPSPGGSSRPAAQEDRAHQQQPRTQSPFAHVLYGPFPLGWTDEDTERVLRQMEAEAESDMEQDVPGAERARSEWNRRNQQRTDAINQIERTTLGARNRAFVRARQHEIQSIARHDGIDRGERSSEPAVVGSMLRDQQAYDKLQFRVSAKALVGDPEPPKTPRHRRASGWDPDDDPFGIRQPPFDLSGLDHETELNCLTPPEKSIDPSSWSENAETRRAVAAAREGELLFFFQRSRVSQLAIFGAEAEAEAEVEEVFGDFNYALAALTSPSRDHAAATGSPRPSYRGQGSTTRHPINLVDDEDEDAAASTPASGRLRPILNPPRPTADSGDSPADAGKKRKHVRLTEGT